MNYVRTVIFSFVCVIFSSTCAVADIVPFHADCKDVSVHVFRHNEKTGIEWTTTEKFGEFRFRYTGGDDIIIDGKKR